MRSSCTIQRVRVRPAGAAHGAHGHGGEGVINAEADRVRVYRLCAVCVQQIQAIGGIDWTDGLWGIATTF